MDEINEEQNPNEPSDPMIGEPDDTVADEPSADDTVTDDTVEDAPPPPASPLTDPQYERLTRDPFATFGGVLSGIAHRYGWDVALTRLAFVVLLIVSGGTAIAAYLLAWLIIPRASHWPPARAHRSGTRLSSRDLGIGLIGLGALVVLGIGSGKAAAVLVPLAMVGGGIWLLLQNPREDEVVTPAMSTAGEAASASQPTVAPYISQPVAPPSSPVAAQPVPRRSRWRRVGIFAFFGTLGLILLVMAGAILLVVGVLANGNIDINTDQKYVYRPAVIDEIDNNITEDVGEIELDLRAVDFDSITPGDDPVDIDVDLDLGKITVLVPEDVRVSVDADVDLGDVTVFGSNDDGINPSRSYEDADPQLILDVNLNAGEIVVTRGNVSTVATDEVN